MVTITSTNMPVESGDLADIEFLKLYRQTPAMMHWLDHEAVLVEVSDQWLKFMGYTREEVIGHKVFEFLTEESRKLAKPHIDTTQTSEGLILYDNREFVKKSGEIIDIELTAYWDQDEEGKPLRALAVLSDVTKRNQATRALTRANEELKATNKELERFAFIASHDLQEPLRKIESACSYIREKVEGKLDADTIKYFDMASKSAARMRDLIENLLRFSRLGTSSVNFKPTDLTMPLKAALSNLQQTIEETGAHIEIDRLPALPIDEAFIRQLFQNLVSNALKYHSNDRPHIHIDALGQYNGSIIRVTDNGIGVQPEYADKIFESFQRLHSKSEYPGSGIGLAICKRIVDRHGGKIWLDINYNKGCRFCVQFLNNPPNQEGHLAHDSLQTN